MVWLGKGRRYLLIFFGVESPRPLIKKKLQREKPHVYSIYKEADNDIASINLKDNGDDADDDDDVDPDYDDDADFDDG